MKRKTPPGTWPLLASGALLLLTTPAVFLGLVVPQWLAITGAFLFLAGAFAALAASYLTWIRVRGTPASGVPIAGVIIGVMPVLLAALLLVPQSMA